jgi:hypothetical protein
MRKDYLSPMCMLFALVLACYWVTYCASVTSLDLHSGAASFYIPYYRGAPSSIQAATSRFFAPAHYLDRRLFRPSKWGGPGLGPQRNSSPTDGSSQ